MTLARAKRVAVTVAILAGLAGVVGCPQEAAFYNCTRPDVGHIGKDGTPDPCHCQTPDAGDVGELKPPTYCAEYLAGLKDGGGGSNPEDP